MFVNVRIDEVLREKGRSFYWLSKESKISYTTLWRLKKGKALGINFMTLEKICAALECEPGDLLKLRAEKQTEKRAEEKKMKKGSF